MNRRQQWAGVLPDWSAWGDLSTRWTTHWYDTWPQLVQDQRKRALTDIPWSYLITNASWSIMICTSVLCELPNLRWENLLQQLQPCDLVLQHGFNRIHYIWLHCFQDVGSRHIYQWRDQNIKRLFRCFKAGTCAQKRKTGESDQSSVLRIERCGTIVARLSALTLIMRKLIII